MAPGLGPLAPGLLFRTDPGPRWGSRPGSLSAPPGLLFRVRFLDRFRVRPGRSPGPTWGPSGVPISTKNGPKTDPETELETGGVRDPLRTSFWSKTGAWPARKSSKSYRFSYDFHEITISEKKPATKPKNHQKWAQNDPKRGPEPTLSSPQAASGDRARTGTDFWTILARFGAALGADPGPGSGPERRQKRAENRSKKSIGEVGARGGVGWRPGGSRWAPRGSRVGPRGA